MASKKALSREKIQAIIDAFAEIDATFTLSGFGGLRDDEDQTEESQDNTRDPAADMETDGEDDEYDMFDIDSSDGPEFDREEIEVGIDAFLSELYRVRLIRKDKKGRLPSFSNVFEVLFEGENELAKKAQEFEDFIEGYFGFISYESMSNARERFREIKAQLEAKIAL